MDEYYKISEAAKYMHIGRTTIYRWINDGKIQKRWIRTFPNGVMAINVKGLVKPRRKKYTKVKHDA